MIPIRIKANQLQHDYSDQGATLNLPAEKAAVLDALDRARVPYGSGEYRLSSGGRVPGFINKALEDKGHNPSLAEMNHLAERLELLSGYDYGKLEGILEIRKSNTVADVINATHNLNRYVQHPVYNDAELGDVAIESDGMFESLEQVPDELLDCLDRAKIGELVRKQDGGVFTEHGYVMLETVGWDAVYDGKSLAGREVTLEPGDPIISLLLSKDEHSYSDNDSGWLHCPADEKEIAAILKKTGAVSLDECAIHEIRCVVPTLADSVFYGTDIGDINTLAGMIQTRCGDDLAKYKAVCEMENVVDINTAMNLTERLGEYEFNPCPSTAAFGRAALAETGADVKLAEEYGFDFHAYGWKAMEEQGARFVAYGFVRHSPGHEQDMEMSEPDSPELAMEM